MKFLCPRHRSMFENLSLKEQNDLWMFWMEHALTFYENGDFENVIMVAGNAVELACLARARHPDSMQIELTLSAILLCQMLRVSDKHCVADGIVCRTLESLKLDASGSVRADGWGSTGQCIEILLDTSRQPHFFAQYLNWPKCPFACAPGQPAITVH